VPAPYEQFSLTPHHVGISVPDVEKSVEWYREIFGFQEVKRLNIPSPGKIVFLKRGNFYIELFEVREARPLPPERKLPDEDLKTHGTKHLAIAVTNFPEVMRYLKQKGVDVVFEREIEGRPMAFIRDNAGNLIELVTPDAP